jgi:potassium/hydrogen antiporter
MNIPASIEYILLGAALLLLVSIVSSKISIKLGIPALLLFVAIGMLAGSEGPGGLYFDDAWLAQFLGIIALVFILFAGGLDTHWSGVRPVLGKGLALATVGVLISGVLVALFATLVLDFTLLEGLLLGVIVSSTDAAAVFAVLRAKGLRLKSGLDPLIELESGSNDPMAVFLTVSLTELLVHSDQLGSGASVTSNGSDDILADLLSLGSSLIGLVPEFVIEMAVGSILGYLFGRGMVLLVNRIRLDYEGLYPVLTMTLMLLAYAVTAALHGNGFLAVYIAGIVMGSSDFVHKRSLTRFHDGFAWLMQIAMFLTLGMLVFPSHLIPVAVPGVLVALFLMFIARPLSVFISLSLSRLGVREKAFIGWVGLRGSVPVILATFPLLAGVSKADTIFNLVFFIVLFSVLLQGTTLGSVAKWLKVEAATPSPGTTQHYPSEFVPLVGTNSRLSEILVPPGSPARGRSIMQLRLPQGALVVLVVRGERNIVPNGATVIAGGDKLLVLADDTATKDVADLVGSDHPQPTTTIPIQEHTPS